MVQLQKVYLLQKTGGPEVLNITEIPIPKIKADEVLIKHEFIGLNFIDIEYRKGLVKLPHNYFIPGVEGVGSVVEIGAKVKDFKIGDRVAYGTANFGGYAEYNAVKADYIVPIPKNIKSETVAAYLSKGMTTHYLMRRTFFVRPDSRVLIHAAAGGVGHLQVKFAKYIGAKIITTVSSDEKESFVRNLGCEYIINYSKNPNFSQEVLAMTEGKGVNVAYDSVGLETFDESLKSLSPFGLMVSFGRSSGAITKFNINQLSAKSLFLTSPKLNHYKQNRLELSLTALEVFGLIDKNIFPSKPEKIYNFSEIPQAHIDLETRTSKGCSVIKV